MNIGEFFSLACALCWAVAVIMFKRSGETLPPFQLNLIKNLICAPLLLATAIGVEGLSLPALSMQDWLIVIVSGIGGIAIADTWYFRALNLMGASRTGITASLYSPFVIILSAVYLGERLGSWQYLGFVLVLGGIMLVHYRRNRRDVNLAALEKGILYAAGSVLLMAASVVVVKPVLEGEGFFWSVSIRMVAGLAGMMLLLGAGSRWQQTRLLLAQPQPWLTIVVAAFLGTYLAMVLWLAGYKYTDASVASILNETAAAFIVLFAWLFLKEALEKQKMLGMALTLAGVFIVLQW